jgi:hypothetical protein
LAIPELWLLSIFEEGIIANARLEKDYSGNAHGPVLAKLAGSSV